MIFTTLGQVGFQCNSVADLPPGFVLHENGWCSPMSEGVGVRTCAEYAAWRQFGPGPQQFWTRSDGSRVVCLNQDSKCIAACRDKDGRLHVYGPTLKQGSTGLRCVTTPQGKICEPITTTPKKPTTPTTFITTMTAVPIAPKIAITERTFAVFDPDRNVFVLLETV
jgi:hypothetical protein